MEISFFIEAFLGYPWLACLNKSFFYQQSTSLSATELAVTTKLINLAVLLLVRKLIRQSFIAAEMAAAIYSYSEADLQHGGKVFIKQQKSQRVTIKKKNLFKTYLFYCAYILMHDYVMIIHIFFHFFLL